MKKTDEKPIEIKPKRTKRYSFPDISGTNPPVVIEATSIEEATALFQKGQTAPAE